MQSPPGMIWEGAILQDLKLWAARAAALHACIAYPSSHLASGCCSVWPMSGRQLGRSAARILPVHSKADFAICWVTNHPLNPLSHYAKPRVRCRHAGIQTSTMGIHSTGISPYDIGPADLASVLLPPEPEGAAER